MAIEYRTSDVVELTEIDPSAAPTGNLEFCGVFNAPYLQHAIKRVASFAFFEAGVRQQPPQLELSGVQFAVFSSTNIGPGGNKICHVVISTHESNTNQRHEKLRFMRAWQVSAPKMPGLVKELLNNRGVLDSEYDRIAAITHNFRYSISLDRQKDLLYSVEDKLPNAPATTLRYGGRKSTIAERTNMKLGLRPTDAGYAMSARDAAAFAEEVFADYDMTSIRIRSDVLGYNVAANCAIAGKVRQRLFDRSYPLELGLQSELVICRGNILHEIAHALDLREMGGFSHGPTFVLFYCELLAKYCNLNFANTYAHFAKGGLMVANPIYSDQFHTLPSEQRREFRKLAKRQTDIRLGENNAKI